VGICAKCFQLFPPDIMSDIDDKAKECAFCKMGKDEIVLSSGKTYTKQNCIDDYKKLLRKLKDSKKVTEILTKED